MTFEEFNSMVDLHDAQLQLLSHDYERGTVQLVADIVVGLPDEPKPQCDRRRKGEIVFEGVQYCMIEPPCGELLSSIPDCPWILSFEKSLPKNLPKQLANAVGSEAPCYSLFIHGWFAHIHIAATNIRFNWKVPDTK
ncbi:MAG: hypothetical protein P4L10_08460 [Acidobacteriaceae bacterium]|nr:hypothetical protein [Acidobacteriaceae bacterium]